MTRRDALLYVVASGFSSFGLGIASFYLNFLYRSLGFDDLAIGGLAAALALGVVAGALLTRALPRGWSRRAVILTGGGVSAIGLGVLLASDAMLPLLVGSALLGGGGITSYAAGTALMADATAGRDRSRIFSQQVALGTIAVFLAVSMAGALATPVAALLDRAPVDIVVLRVLIGIGALFASLAVIPVLLVRAVPVPMPAIRAPRRRGLLLRFAMIEGLFGLGSGSVSPFLNLFFADRFGSSFTGIGVALAVIAVAGTVGALFHARFVEPRLGALRAIIVVELCSLPFAIGAGITLDPAVATALLAARAALIVGSTAAFTAFTLSSFTPAERAGAAAFVAIVWHAASAAGAYLSGVVRELRGPDGYAINLDTLAAAYLAAAILSLLLLRDHQPAGDLLRGPDETVLRAI